MKFNSSYTLLVFRAAFVAMVISVTTLSLIDLRELPPVNVWDKLEHASAFLLLSFLLDQSLPQHQSRRTLHWGQMLMLLAYGILIEWLQGHTAYREASFMDVVADACGIGMYWLIYFVRHAGTNRTANT